jgi:hypothetical protein
MTIRLRDGTHVIAVQPRHSGAPGVLDVDIWLNAAVYVSAAAGLEIVPETI